jgi:hypothetical protein
VTLFDFLSLKNDVNVPSKSNTKKAGSGSGSISQRHGSADPYPDPHQNVMDPQHCGHSAVGQYYAGAASVRLEYLQYKEDDLFGAPRLMK